jgi:hypothetical protein
MAVPGVPSVASDAPKKVSPAPIGATPLPRPLPKTNEAETLPRPLAPGPEFPVPDMTLLNVQRY